MWPAGQAAVPEPTDDFKWAFTPCSSATSGTWDATSGTCAQLEGLQSRHIEAQPQHPDSIPETSILSAYTAPVAQISRGRGHMAVFIASITACPPPPTIMARPQTSRALRSADELVAELQAQIELQRVQRLENAVGQTILGFRHHATAAPGLYPARFIEANDDIIGQGGCATVYRWQPAAGDDWVVKVDYTSYRHAGPAENWEPESCAQLLPAFLPAHPNLLAPVAWWVGPLEQDSTSTTAGRSAAEKTASATQAQATGFRVFTVWPRLSCSLWEHVHSLNRKRVEMDLEDMLVVVRDVAAALQHLRKHRICHSDVKPENVCLSYEASGKVKSASIIDCGMAVEIPSNVDRMVSRGGTWPYKAPEQLTGPPPAMLPNADEVTGPMWREPPHVDLNTDLWSLGAVLCSMVHGGSLPSVAGLPLEVKYSQVLKWGDRTGPGGRPEPFYMTWESVLPPQPALEAWSQHSRVMSLLRRLATGCMHSDSKQRMAADEVCTAADEMLTQLRAARIECEQAALN
eukprot:CAMPEP_0119107970 /NCGR_PEP_ID=MMETSP1180-20130426/12667_1 /TAXON_ID=3052 ORGANISM="Chlamydomonas cf sp, Strain CCMP681" /NCGR_SAMPLE_ID=MMETSP1180 /ASSEMBLY_ACC=CAM_ASM_000741 /LENGTH=516 /DNA_ID=CAMNT_0007093525 /DNA_START=261 /DNA_END=1812 /DNA_ORIENTATION=+